MAELFWSNVNADPKRQYRFTLNMGNIPVWTVKTAMKPKSNVSIVEHSFINHTFKYPGRVTWDNITVTLVDPVDPDLAMSMLDALRNSGYQYPTDSNVRGSISKAQSVRDGLGSVTLRQIDGDGRSRSTAGGIDCKAASVGEQIEYTFVSGRQAHALTGLAMV